MRVREALSNGVLSRQHEPVGHSSKLTPASPRKCVQAVDKCARKTCPSAGCAASACVRLLQRSRRLRARYPLGRLPNLMSKGKGENSMLEKHLNVKIGNVK